MTDASPKPVRQTRVGSVGNILAGLASFGLPGLGQMLQGRRWSVVATYFAWWFVAALLNYYLITGNNPYRDYDYSATRSVGWNDAPYFWPMLWLLIAVALLLLSCVTAAREAAMWNGKETSWQKRLMFWS